MDKNIKKEDPMDKSIKDRHDDEQELSTFELMKISNPLEVRRT